MSLFFPTAHFAQGDRSSYVNHFSKWLLKVVIRKLVRLYARWRFLGIVSVQIIPGCSWQTCIVMVKNIFRSLQFWFRKSQIKYLCLAHSAEISYFDLQFWIYFARQVNYKYIMCTVLTVEEARSNFFLEKTQPEAIEIFSQHNLDFDSFKHWLKYRLKFNLKQIREHTYVVTR